jgi:hypothetical protein
MNPENICREVYAETTKFYDRYQNDLGGFGFKILYGPPMPNAPILFMGYQPGGSVPDGITEKAAGAHAAWPRGCEYATADWRLAQNMRSMFGTSLLARCTGFNAVFFRAPTTLEYKHIVSLSMRTKAERFCREQIQRLLNALSPQKLVGIGFDGLRLLTTTEVGLISDRGRVLTITGVVAGIPCVAALHLSGAQISAADRRAIASKVLEGVQ